MPAPEVNVLLEMFNLYVELDKGEGEDHTKEPQPSNFYHTFTGFLTHYSGKLRKLLDRVGPELTQLCDEVLGQIKEKNTPKKWVAFILAAGNAAEAAQKKKKKAGQSRSCEILHMLRSYALMVMTSADDEYKKAIDDKMGELKARIMKQQEDIIFSTHNTDGAGVDEMIKKRDQDMVDLAYLSYKAEEAMFIVNAQSVGKLNYLLNIKAKEAQLSSEFGVEKSVCRKYNANEALKYCMQNFRSQNGKNCWFWIVHFEERFRKRLNKDALRYLQESREKKKNEAPASGEQADDVINGLDAIRKEIEVAVKTTIPAQAASGDAKAADEDDDEQAKQVEDVAKPETSPKLVKFSMGIFSVDPDKDYTPNNPQAEPDSSPPTP